MRAILRNINLLYINATTQKEDGVATLLQLLCEHVHIVHGKQDAVGQSLRLMPEIIVLDMESVDFDGVALLDELRAANAHCAILAITTTLHDTAAVKKSVQKTLMKPFDSAELVAGLRACTEHLMQQKDFMLSAVKMLSFDVDAGMLYAGGEPLHLTSKEKKLLELLYKNHRRIVTYPEIEHYVWKDQSMSMGSLKSIVNKIRTKVGMSDFIRNYSNEGYKLNTDLLTKR